MPSDLKTAIENFIRAEWQFRSGPDAYKTTTEKWYVKSTEKLRKAVTGEKDLEKAYQKLKELD